MKIIIKLAIIAMFAAGSLFAALIHRAPTVFASPKAGPRSLYIQNCATCHGSNGKAQTRRGKKLEATDLTSSDVQSMDRAKIIRAITSGRPGMPSFKKKLTARQIAQIADYVHAF